MNKSLKMNPEVKDELQTCYIALGSNQQNPVQQVKLAIEDIAQTHGIALIKISSMYTTKPVGFSAQPDFINAVVEIKTNLSPEALLIQLMAIESKRGRVRTGQKNGPRIIDLDILLYGQIKFSSEQLTIPHPRMWERAFVLDPLFEIAPELRNIGVKQVTAKNNNMLNTAAWQELLAHKERLQAVSTTDLFAQDNARFTNLSFTANNFLYDISKQHLDLPTLASLLKLAEASGLRAQIDALYRGDIVNHTEQRPALHIKLRQPGTDLEIKAVQQQMAEFVAGIHSGSLTGCTGKKIKHIVSLGIGGSELGPLMTRTALQNFCDNDLDLQFITNVDAETVASVLAKVAPDQTVCIVNSKTFTTPETMLNAKAVKNWLHQHLGHNANKQLFAVTTNVAKAQEFGILAENIFKFWDWVGGRYSVWSAVGLPLALKIGWQNFSDFLAGAHEMDEHFYNADFAENLPVLMALVGIWNINLWDRHTLAIIPYLDSLTHLPAYLQQLEMESNGKIAGNFGQYVPYKTAPIIWGGVGCNGQHAYMQLLHQGSHVIPVDFIAAVNSHGALPEQQQLLLASCLSQSKALMEGCSVAELSKNNPGLTPELIKAKTCPGSRPSSTILFPKLTPKILGNLIAWYEHKVFVQGIIWQIQSFDQWGVELGKQLAKSLLSALDTSAVDLDQSSTGLINYITKCRHCELSNDGQDSDNRKRPLPRPLVNDIAK